MGKHYNYIFLGTTQFQSLYFLRNLEEGCCKIFKFFLFTCWWMSYLHRISWIFGVILGHYCANCMIYVFISTIMQAWFYLFWCVCIFWLCEPSYMSIMMTLRPYGLKNATKEVQRHPTWIYYAYATVQELPGRSSRTNKGKPPD